MTTLFFFIGENESSLSIEIMSITSYSFTFRRWGTRGTMNDDEFFEINFDSLDDCK